MKRNSLSLALGAFAAAAVFSACTGPSGSGIPSATAPGAAMKALAASSGAVVVRKVYAGLSFDGTTFTVDAHGSCGHRGLGGITPYVAPTSGPLVFGTPAPFTPACLPKHMPTTTPQLYIFAIARHGKGSGHTAGAAHWNGVPVAGPANLTDNPWIFAPLSPGLTMVGGDNYDFVIATSR